MGIRIRQNEWGKRVLGTYALVDWYDCLNSPAPSVSVKHVGDPDMMRGFRAGGENRDGGFGKDGTCRPANLGGH